MRWRDARTADEREALLAEARTAGAVGEAAADLGVSRRHLTRLLTGEERATGAGPVVAVTLQLERELAEWLEIEAVRLKQRAGGRHPSKSAVVAELIRAAMGARRADGA